MSFDWIEAFRRYRSLPIRKQWLLWEAVLFLLLIRIGLEVMSYSSLRGFLERVPAVFGGRFAPSASRNRIRWAVTTSGSVLPGTYTCLVRAMAAELLLERRGYSATLQLGVDSEDEEFVAHAWVESGDVIVVGRSERAQFTRLE